MEARHPWDSIARASQAQVKDAAEALTICLIKSPPEGGRAWNFSKQPVDVGTKSSNCCQMMIEISKF